METKPKPTQKNETKTQYRPKDNMSIKEVDRLFGEGTYKRIRGDKTMEDLEEEAIGLGLERKVSWVWTDTMLVAFIAGNSQ